MLYFKINEALEVVAVGGFPGNNAELAMKRDGTIGAGWISRMDWSDNPAPRMFAQQLAESASKLGGDAYALSDAGPNCWPRYDVIAAPKLGDEVSMAFNGDSYPVGKIVAIKPDLKRVVVDGERGRKIFIRRGESGAWLNKGWSLVCGSVFKLNPEF